MSHPDVAVWVKSLQLHDAQPRPTLFRIGGSSISADRGARLIFSLMHRLGARSGIQVVRALGALKRIELPEQQPDGKAIDRKHFLQLAAGAAVASAIVLNGKTPAIADAEGSSAASWVAKNRDRLPQDYDEFSQYPPLYRHAIYNALPADARSSLWVSQLQRAATHTPEQRGVLDRALTTAGDVALFAGPLTAVADGVLQALRTDAIAAFGHATARGLFTQLGGAGRTQGTLAIAVTCECSAASSWCGDQSCIGQIDGCTQTSGCGTFWQYTCDGMCR